MIHFHENTTDTEPERSRTVHGDLVSLLELDPDVGTGLEARPDGSQPHKVPVRILSLAPGAWTPPPERPGSVTALFVARGFLLRRRPIGERTVAQLVGPRDVFDPWVSADLPGAVSWSAATPVRVAVLDHRAFRAVNTVPELAAGLFRRLGENAEHAAALAAVVHLPRAEQRVLALLWRLVERWGRVRPDGYVLDLPLTHVMIGQLIGARRPTVSLALAQLAEEGKLTRLESGGWLLSHAAATTSAA